MIITPKALWYAQYGKCFYCSKDMDTWSAPLHTDNGWTRDHFLPVKYLRKAKIKPKYNMVLAHAKCNLKKGHRLPNKREVSRFKIVYGELLGNLGGE